WLLLIISYQLSITFFRNDFRQSKSPLASAGVSAGNARLLLVVLTSAAGSRDSIHSSAFAARLDRRHFHHRPKNSAGLPDRLRGFPHPCPGTASMGLPVGGN